jgi:hypothetical protein
MTILNYDSMRGGNLTHGVRPHSLNAYNKSYFFLKYLNLNHTVILSVVVEVIFSFI